MIRSTIISEDAQAHFWHVVKCCLVEFHGLTVPSASGKVRRYREKVEEQLSREAIELFFHAEPFEVACRITDRRLDVTDYLLRYLEIRDEQARKNGDVLP